MACVQCWLLIMLLASSFLSFKRGRWRPSAHAACLPLADFVPCLAATPLSLCCPTERGCTSRVCVQAAQLPASCHRAGGGDRERQVDIHEPAAGCRRAAQQEHGRELGARGWVAAVETGVLLGLAVPRRLSTCFLQPYGHLLMSKAQKASTLLSGGLQNIAG